MNRYIEVSGNYNTAKVFNPNVDENSLEQVRALLDREEFKDSRIRFMPDIHYGKGATVGTTMTLTDQVVPNFIGVDIGCGVSVTKLDIPTNEAIQDKFLKRFDRVVRQNVPLGFNRHKEYKDSPDVSFEEFLVKDTLDEETFHTSIGTLGGGNHFISLEANDYGEVYLLIHSGSRNIGLTVANTYQDMADQTSPGKPKGNGVVSGELFEQYLHDLALAQRYAKQNRKQMRDTILAKMNMGMDNSFDTIHNYIEVETNIARKGAVSAKEGETLVIPFNSRDGSVIAIGKGNEDWNYSAPHGAGRTMSRRQAKRTISLEEYREMMVGVFSSSISNRTLDEAPTAYKEAKEILDLSEPTLSVKEWLQPIYNLKG